MPLKTSLLSKPLFMTLSRHIIFITVVNIICTFLLIPFSYMLATIVGNNVNMDSSQYIAGQNYAAINLYLFGTICYSIIAGVMLSYYLKSDSASDFIHSLPYKRTTILTTTYAAFKVHLLLNLVLNAVILLIINPMYTHLTGMKILNWMLLSAILALFIFTVTLVVGLLVNNVVSHLVFTVFILMLPMLFNLVFHGLTSMMYTGLSSDNSDFAMKLTVPVYTMMQVTRAEFPWDYWLIVLAVTLVLFIVSYIIYKNRRNENINEGYANKPAEYILFTLIVTLGTLFAVALAITIFLKNFIFMFIIFIIAYFLLYYLMEMIAQKAVRITVHRKLMFTSLVVSALTIISVLILGNIEEHKLPNASEVKSVSIENDDYGEESNRYLKNQKISDPEYIKDAIKIHKSLIGQTSEVTSGTVTISYTLNDGSTLKRVYNVNETQISAVDKVLNSNANIDKRLKTIDWNEIASKQLKVERYNYNSNEMLQLARLLNKEEKDQLIDALKEDTNTLKHDDARVKLAKSEIVISDGDGPFLNITPYHKETIKVLKDLNIIKETIDIYDESNFKRVDDPRITDDLSGVTKDMLWNIKGKEISRKEAAQLLNSNKVSTKGTSWYVHESNAEPSLFSVTE